MVDGIKGGWYGPLYYPHISVQGCVFIKNKVIQVYQIQLFDHLWPGGWKKKLRWINITRMRYKIERVIIPFLTCLPSLIFKHYLTV